MRLGELRYKEVINICTGHRLGFVYDADFDMSSGKLLALIVPGAYRFFGLFGREEDYIIPFENISRVGDDIILAEVQGEYKRGQKKKRSFF